MPFPERIDYLLAFKWSALRRCTEFYVDGVSEYGLARFGFCVNWLTDVDILWILCYNVININ